MVSLIGILVNAVVGLVVLFAANLFGLGVQISVFTLLICAILGLPGAILVILLALFNVAFSAAILPLLLL